jgi:small ligand-binding sensory domain FIST
VNEETTVIAAAKPKRTYSEPTKADYIIRCMAAENTVKAQDIELRQERGRAITLHAQLQDAEEQAENLRARVARRTTEVSVMAVIAIVLAFALMGLLIGGAR